MSRDRMQEELGRTPAERRGCARAALLAVLAVAVATLVGCSSNAYRESYRSSLERWPSGEVSRLLPRTGKAQILTSNDIEEDANRMMENGYLLLGRSRFQSEQVNPEAAREVADDLGASVVLVKAQYAKTVQEAIPVERYIPTRREHASRAAAGGNERAPMLGEFRMTYVRKSVDYFDLAATFWAKSKPPIFGVLVEGRGDKVRQSDPSGETPGGRGVVIRAVIADSPAAAAGVLRGDVIVRFAGTEITDPDQFFDTVVANKGRDVEVDLVRVEKGQELKLKVQLRDE